MPLSEDTCLIGVGGPIEASAPALAHFPGRILNALDVADVDGHLLVIVGTEVGEVIQVDYEIVFSIWRLLENRGSNRGLKFLSTFSLSKLK